MPPLNCKFITTEDISDMLRDSDPEQLPLKRFCMNGERMYVCNSIWNIMGNADFKTPPTKYECVKIDCFIVEELTQPVSHM